MKIDQLIRSKRKSVGLYIGSDGRLIVRAPLRAPRILIDAFVHEKEPWILEKQALARQTLICRPGFFAELSAKTEQLTCGLQQAADAAGVPVLTTRVGGMFGLFFTNAAKVVNFAEAGACDVGAFKAFFHHMLERGV